MRKNALAKVLALVVCAVTVAPMAACGNGGGGEEIDETKTQLHVSYHFSGFGEEWMKELKKNFEAKYANVSFEEGKMGVQLANPKGDTTSTSLTAAQIGQYDVYFMEQPYNIYNIMAEGALEPLDELYTKKNDKDGGKTIDEKVSKAQKDAYTYGGHVYAIPHYEGNYGLIYNAELFESRGYYFAAEPDKDTGIEFVTEENPTKSMGPDGKTGVQNGIDYSLDDGLPTTYDEFFKLCQWIRLDGYHPVCFPGAFATMHLTMLMDNLMTVAAGPEQMRLNYTYSGTANNLIMFDKDNNIIFENDGVTPKTESLLINDNNAYNLSRQANRYYGMEFMDRFLSDTDNFNKADAINKTLLHTDNQENFIKNESAMLADGGWWQAEAIGVFQNMEKDDAKYSQDARKFGWLPLPQPTKAEAAKIANGTKKSAYSDYLCAVACVSAGLPTGVKDAAFALLQYMYSDEGLANFTYTTGTTIGVDYLDTLDENKLNYYEKTLINYIKKSETVHEYSSNDLYRVNFAKLVPPKAYGNGKYDSVWTGIYQSEVSAVDYFKGHQNLYKGIAWGN